MSTDTAAEPDTSFSQRLWREGEPTYRQILTHPFLLGLADGTLPREAFRYFVVQDSHYLRAYSRCLALVAGRSPVEDAVRTFALHAANAVDVERELHASLLGELGITEADVEDAGVAPTTLAYTSYLTSVCATGSWAEGVAAVLPCYWVYREVGRTLVERSSPDPLYARWIATYGSPEFDAVVDQVLTVTDALDVSATEQARCREHFAVTTRYEWMFWDAAWRQYAWPV
ncbi:thiaminase II [Auraticoccus monumenti]|uniref:Aminopyrimidine aminohydrolase n=1 Tax=Auraticoccus monumenti TaxID=675864 RepID=A0A1G6SKW3_9ACTN|nr:thiaminase II [Auraticoccus monumenti]SDD17519.1 thiaminase (transcriptional activator TenA) [Auraticoccus monumenti]